MFVNNNIYVIKFVFENGDDIMLYLTPFHSCIRSRKEVYGNIIIYHPRIVRTLGYNVYSLQLRNR